MFKFLFFMFFLFMLLLFLMGFSVLRSFKRFFFGESNRSESSRPQSSHRPSSSRAEEETRRSRATQRKKIFTQDDGEYVDYEEVK